MMKNTITTARRKSANGLRILEALASPARQELMTALGDGPATASELSGRLGRSRQALYYHLASLEKAGLVRVRAMRGQGRDRERVYERVPRRLVLKGRRLSPPERAAAERAASAMLRLTRRELSSAIRLGEDPARGPSRGPIALRGKARLGRAELDRARTLIREIALLFRRTQGRNASEPLYAVTLVLTPSPEAVPPIPPGTRRQERS
jgi:DNA-binding transcriptional ArsR family regulator